MQYSVDSLSVVCTLWVYSAPPDPLAVGEGAGCRVPKNHTRLGASDLSTRGGVDNCGATRWLERYW